MSWNCWKIMAYSMIARVNMIRIITLVPVLSFLMAGGIVLSLMAIEKAFFDLILALSES
jgi:hypothetical protein